MFLDISNNGGVLRNLCPPLLFTDVYLGWNFMFHQFLFWNQDQLGLGAVSVKTIRVKGEV